MLASDLLSGIDRGLFDSVRGETPLVEQRLVRAVGDQPIDGAGDGVLENSVILRNGDPGELGADRGADEGVGVRFLRHYVGQRLVALDGGVDAALPKLGASV